MERNHFLNLLKCFACMAIVFIHVRFPGDVGTIIAYMSSWAVPLFMMISGYYAFGCGEHVIKRRLIKFVRILGFGLIVFTILNASIAYKDQCLEAWLKEALSLFSLVKLLVFCSIKDALPLWYMVAMIETYLFWWVIVRKKGENNLVKYTWILFVLSVLTDITVQTFGIRSEYSVLFFFKALPWFMLGYMLKRDSSSFLDRFRNGQLCSWILTVEFVCLLLVSLNLPLCALIGGLFSAMAAPSLMLLCVRNESLKVPRFFSYTGDKLSLFIYIFHVPISKLIHYTVVHGGMDTIGIYEWIHPIVTILESILVSICFVKIIKISKVTPE